jgi:mycothiol synthase
MRADDEPAIREAMLAAHARGELDGVTRQQLVESVERLGATPWLGAVAEDEGRLAGWVVPRHDDLLVDLPFRRRGHGRRLLEAGRIIAGHLGYPELRVWVPPHPVPEAFARAGGLTYHSSLWLMRLAADALPVPPRFPDDVAVRWIEPGEDEPAFVELVNEIFLDHPSPLSLELEEVRRVHGRSGFDPSTILLVAPAGARDRLVAFCRVGTFQEDDGSLAGEVKLVGVRREARGTGLGRELVRWGIGALRERAVTATFLSVESENEGALRVYEREGFERELEWPHWSAPVIVPGASAAGSP